MCAQKKTSKKTNSSIQGVDFPIAPVTRQVRNDLRIFAGFTGGGAGLSATFYTVPAGKIFKVENVFIVSNQNITSTGDTVLKFVARSGSEIWRAEASNAESPQNIITKEMTLYAGDSVQMLYTTTDVNGQFLTTVIGIEEETFVGYPF